MTSISHKRFGKSGTMREVRTSAVCHPDARHHGKGLCAKCSGIYWRTVRAGGAPPPDLQLVVFDSDSRESVRRQEAAIERADRAELGLTQERARQKFFYDPETGVVARRSDLGDPAGYIDERGYVRIEIDGAAYRAHQIAWLIVTGNFIEEIDHRDGDPANNRWNNLRAATHSQNMHNRGKSRANTSGHKGVSFHAQSGKWRAAITVGMKRHSLGLHMTKEAAADAYKNASLSMMGEFARSE